MGRRPSPFGPLSKPTVPPIVPAVEEIVERVGRALLRRDVRNPHLAPGERYLLDFHRTAWPGDVVLVHRDGAFAVEIAPTTATIVAVVRVLDPT